MFQIVLDSSALLAFFRLSIWCVHLMWLLWESLREFKFFFGSSLNLRQFKNNMFMCFHPFYGNVRLFQKFRAVQFFF